MTKLIGEYLIEDGKINHEQLQKALEIQANSMQGGRMPLVGTVLVEVLHALGERDLTASLERQEQARTGQVRNPVPSEAHTDPRAA